MRAPFAPDAIRTTVTGVEAKPTDYTPRIYLLALSREGRVMRSRHTTRGFVMRLDRPGWRRRCDQAFGELGGVS